MTDSEFALIKQHPVLGYDLLKELDLDYHVKQAALSHHERCDGSGYPLGLKADEIDSHAMIIAIADVYDAMTSARKYRTRSVRSRSLPNLKRMVFLNTSQNIS